MTPIVDQFFEVGIAWIVSLSMTCRRMTLVVSTTGASPLTVMVSSIAPTRSSTLTGAVNERRQLDAFAPDTRKPGEREGNGIDAGPEIDDVVAPLRVRRDRS